MTESQSKIFRKDENTEATTEQKLFPSQTGSKPATLVRGNPIRQIVVALIANFGTINTGMMFGFSAVAIPQLQSENSTIKINENEASWVASLSSISTPIGCIFSGYLMDYIGRKMTLMILDIPLMIGWICISTATNLNMIYIGRLLIGLGSGMVGAPSRVYTSEVTQPHLRGTLGALASVAISSGVLVQYILGAYVTWQMLAGISFLFPLLNFCLLIFVPESPIFLMNKSKYHDASICLQKLRSSKCNVNDEVESLKTFTDQSRQSSNAGKTNKMDLWHVLFSQSTLKPFGILVFYFMMYQFSGVNTVTFYAVSIFQDSGTTMDKYTCTILLGSIRLLFTVIACIALRKCGRRPLTFISGIGCGVSMIGLGAYMYYKHNCESSTPPVVPAAAWIPVICIFFFTITCTLGFLVVPWVMIGELYPQKIRGIVGGMTTCCAHIFVFIVVKTYPFLVHLLNHYGVFVLYGLISLIGSIFLYFWLPETKGKTLQEIQRYFSEKNKCISPNLK